MTQAIRVPEESLPITTNWGSPVIGEVPVATPPITSKGVVIHVDFSGHGDAQSLPEGFVDIDDLVTEHERNPARRAALEEGRRAVARNYYGDRSGLAVLRLQKGWSQRKLADVTGMKQPHIARLERGQNDPSLGTMRRLASALGVELAAIVRALDSDTMGAS